MIGMDFKDIFKILISKSAQVISNMQKGNIFNHEDGHPMLTSIFKTLDTNPPMPDTTLRKIKDTNNNTLLYHLKVFSGSHNDAKISDIKSNILELINNTKLKMNETIAGKIYIGIVSDSNRFLYNVNYKTFELVAELIKKYKLDVDKLYRLAYAKPLSEVRLMGYIASTMKVDKYGFGYIELEDDVIQSLNSDISAASNMINDFNNINEVIVWAFSSHDAKNNMYRVNIRSRGPVINEIAAKYHGGGHKYASGVRTDSKEDVDNLMKDLSRVCKEYIEREKN